ncbi:hypothetical protein AK812_SmicGene46843, partial [Symbiodinium microadriaticum]
GQSRLPGRCRPVRHVNSCEEGRAGASKGFQRQGL